jgi:small GTP-binding protein
MTQNNCKLIVVGASGVGKTSILNHTLRGYFEEDSLPTVGSSYSKYHFEEGPQPICFEIWDTAGQEKYRTLMRNFFNNTKVALFVFDLTNIESLSELDYFYNAVIDVCPPGSFLIGLIGNKCDLRDTIVVSEQQMDEVARKLNAEFTIMCSAKTGEGTKDIFVSIAQSPNLKFNSPAAEALVLVDETDAQKKERKANTKCC